MENRRRYKTLQMKKKIIRRGQGTKRKAGFKWKTRNRNTLKDSRRGRGSERKGQSWRRKGRNASRGEK